MEAVRLDHLKNKNKSGKHVVPFNYAKHINPVIYLPVINF